MMAEVLEKEARTQTCKEDADLKRQGRNTAAWLRFAGLIVFLAAMGILAWTKGAGDWLRPDRLVDLLQGYGTVAPVMYMLMMAAAVVISPIPSLPLDAAAGAVFGSLWGTVYSVLGAVAGAIISFYIARFLGREAIARLLKRDIAFCDLCAERHLFYIVFLARLLPMFSFDLVSYGAGLTRISLRAFALATLIGMIPATFAVNYFGSGIFSGSGLPWILGGVLVAMFFGVPIWIKRRNPWGLYDHLLGGERKP